MKKEKELSWAEIKAMFAETDKQFKETDRRFKETDKKVDKMCERIDRLGEHLGGISNSNGDMAEEYFFNTLNRDKKFANETFDRMKRNVSYDEND
ncbi:MAG: hypothetical protein LBU83_14210, partial [Bacteroidales bacterium]|nr:hypothetical protein [Bacteroidales bacterium]